MNTLENRKTLVNLVNPISPDPAVIAHAGQILRQGGLVAFPTETVYGLGANALNPNAVKGIYSAKGRPSNNPLIVHVVTKEMRNRLITDWPANAELLAQRFWPGPLTLVLPKSSEVPDEATGGGPTVAIREPVHPVARALIFAANCPVAAPSANRSNEISPTLAEHVLKGLDGRIDLILDGGPCYAGIESTVIDVSNAVPKILRFGPLSRELIESVIGPVEIPLGHLDGDALPSPGMLSKHYSPKTATILVQSVAEIPASATRWGVLSRQPITGFPGKVFVMPNDPVAYAADLYARLHEMDAGQFEGIAIIDVPHEPAWVAVRDRITRACG